MHKFGKIAIPVYALLMLAGGIGGYAKKHSLPSLLAGIVSAVLLGGAYSMLNKKPKTAYGLSLGVAILLAVVFVERAVKTAAEPGGMMRNVGLAALSLVVAAVFAKCAAETPA